MRVSGCIASSIRSPSTYGQLSTEERCPGIRAGSYNVVNSTYLALEVGLKRASSSLRGKPIHGTTSDHASTQRNR